MLDLTGRELKMDYPCKWLYKVIGANQQEIRQAIQEVGQKEKYKITNSNRSKGGKYFCLNMEMTVSSEEQRNEIYQALKNHSLVKMVL